MTTKEVLENNDEVEEASKETTKIPDDQFGEDLDQADVTNKDEPQMDKQKSKPEQKENSSHRMMSNTLTILLTLVSTCALKLLDIVL